MHKFPIPIAHDIHPNKSRWSLLRNTAIIVLGIASGPADLRRILDLRRTMVSGDGTERPGQDAAARYPPRRT